MTLSEYLSKRISWDTPLRLPRLSLPPIFRLQTLKSNTLKCQEVDDTSTDITAIPYPSNPATGRRAWLHAYIRHATEPFIRRFRPQADVPVPEPTTTKLNAANMPVIRSIFQFPPSPTASPISPVSILLVPESAVVSQLQTDRAIRAEQDAAYGIAQELDQSLIERFREQRLREEQRLKELAEQEEQERTCEREKAAYRRAQNDWRRWARRALVPIPEVGNDIQFAVRLPCGQRRIGKLPSDASLEVVYLFVETLLIPPSFYPEDDPEDPPEGYEHRWGFRLVTTNSRFVVPNGPNSKICGIKVMKKGVLLIVEEVEDNDLEEPSKVV